MYAPLCAHTYILEPTRSLSRALSFPQDPGEVPQGSPGILGVRPKNDYSGSQNASFEQILTAFAQLFTTVNGIERFNAERKN